MGVVSAERLRDVLRSTFWLIPALCVAGAIALAVGLVAVDNAIGSLRAEFLFPGPPAAARGLLSSITQAMIAFTGLVFSITVVVLQLTSSQFSPRALRTFLRDRTIQWTLGIFVATFVYAMVVLRNVLGSSDRNGFVPRIAVTVASAFVLLSVGLFIRYIDHVANMIRVVSIITEVGDESRRLLERRYPCAPPVPAGKLDVPPHREIVAAPTAGVLVALNEQAIVRRAARDGLVVVVLIRVGDFVPLGAPLVEVHSSAGNQNTAGWLRRYLAFASERTTEQDFAFGFRQLVDIAERALSPAVNDPTTACQAIDVLHDLLRRLATRPPPSGRFTDAGGQVRLVVPQYSFADLLHVVVAEIWRYGSDAAQVPERLATMLGDLRSVALPEHRDAVEYWLTVVAGRQPSRTGS